MGRRGKSYDNAKAESFMKTLNVEAVYPMAYETFANVANDLPRFIDAVYNGRSIPSLASSGSMRKPLLEPERHAPRPGDSPAGWPASTSRRTVPGSPIDPKRIELSRPAPSVRPRSLERRRAGHVE
jgi:hypothetical protein